MFSKLFGKKEKEIKKDEIKETNKVPEAKEIITGEVVGNESVVNLEQKETKEIKEIEPTTIDLKHPPVQEPVVTHNDGEQPQEPPPLTRKEMKALKRSCYEEKIMNNSRFKKAYLIKNIKTGQIVEIRAASSFHACNIIGWKVNRVRILSEKEIKEEKSQPETVASSSNPT